MFERVWFITAPKWSFNVKIIDASSASDTETFTAILDAVVFVPSERVGDSKLIIGAKVSTVNATLDCPILFAESFAAIIKV